MYTMIIKIISGIQQSPDSELEEICVENRLACLKILAPCGIPILTYIHYFQNYGVHVLSLLPLVCFKTHHVHMCPICI